jgi:hypothetical protein
MNVTLLIGAIVRQTTVLIAELATAGGVRAPLAHVADKVFMDLVRELERQGVSRKVSADMFGMGLRSYLRRIQRLGESSTESGRSLWEAVLDYLEERGVVSRSQVFARFHRDDEVLVRGVLHDLAESGLVFVTGSGADSAYRAASEDELGALRRVRQAEGLDELVWAIVYRSGPLSKAELLVLGGVAESELTPALERLVGDERVVLADEDGTQKYRATTFFVPLGAAAGFEASVFDHFQAVVQTVSSRLRREPPPLELPPGLAATDVSGGSTYTLDLYAGHPDAEEALRTLAEFRTRLGALRQRVDTHNREHGLPASFVKLVSYAGQCLVQEDAGEEKEA